MPSLSEQEFVVLNGAHLKKMATAEELARAVGLELDAVEAVLVEAEKSGLLMAVDEKYLLLPDGTSAVHEHYRSVYQPLRSDETILDWYDRFETINEQFIKQVSEWQSTDGDARVQSRLLKTVERLSKNMQEIIPLVPRYENYVRRFAESVARIDEGDRDYVCKPTIDSIHNVWFEFHEDILSVIGRPRDT